MINTLLNSGVEGLSRSQNGLHESAKIIASGGQAGSVNSSGQPPVSSDEAMLTAVVDLNLYEVQFKASAKVVSTADETIGTLLDEFA